MKVKLLFVFAVFVTFISGQNVSRNFADTYNAYLTEYLSLDFNVHVYQNKNDSKGQLVGKGVIRKYKKEYFSSFDKQITIMNPKGAIFIDQRSKNIVYVPGKQFEFKTEKANPLAIDSLLKYTDSDSLAFIGIENNLKHFRIETEDAPIKVVDYYVDSSTSLIKRIVYTYNEDTKDYQYSCYKMVIDYTTASSSRFDVQKYFDNALYLNKSNGKWSGGKLYQDYFVQIVTEDKQ